jgi:hypothetical protein
MKLSQTLVPTLALFASGALFACGKQAAPGGSSFEDSANDMEEDLGYLEEDLEEAGAAAEETAEEVKVVYLGADGCGTEKTRKASKGVPECCGSPMIPKP